jgi:hypothetical protein
MQLASELETPPAPAPAPQVTSTTTQIQLGCLSQCFGTTTTDPSTAALTQSVLSELSSLVPPSGSIGLQATPATEQSTVDQVACQLQNGAGTVGAAVPNAASTPGAQVPNGPGTPGMQVQRAAQSSTTVQIMKVVSSLPAYLDSGSPGSQPPPVQAADQTRQQTWQLQVGCLFYCVDSQQVQQAQQSVTIVQMVAEPPGPAGAGSGSTVDVVDQTIWQLQVGCLAWCYDSTQSQQASSEVTITVPGGPPPSDAPTPAPAGATAPPGPAPAAKTPPEHPLAVGQPAAPPTAPPAASTSPPATTLVSAPAGPSPASARLAGWAGRAGLAILGRRAALRGPASPLPTIAVATISIRTAGLTAGETTRARFEAVRGARLNRPPSRRDDPRPPAGTYAPARALEAVVPRPTAGVELALAAILAIAGALSADAVRRRRRARH